MTSRERIHDIRLLVQANLGQEVSLEVEKGKKRSKQSNGVIKAAFNDVFTVLVDPGLKSERIESYSYTDVLIEHIEIVFRDTEERLYVS